MKLKSTFETVDMGDELIAVPIGEGADKVSGVIKLNKSGKQILDLLSKGLNENEVVEYLSMHYDNDRETLKLYVEKIIKVLNDAGLLAE